MIDDAQNKAVQQPPKAKVAFDPKDVTVISAKDLKGAVQTDNLRGYQADGQAYMRYPAQKNLQKNLTREQREAAARRGVKLD